MDELTLLRETRSAIPEPSLAELEAGFERLERRMMRRRTRTQERRIRWTVAIAATAVAVTAVGQTTVAVQSAEAATVLDAAADNVITSVDPVVGPGQWLKVETLAHWGINAEDNLRWMAPQTLDVYTPYDPDAEWTLVRTYGKPDSFRDAASKQAALDGWDQRDAASLTEVFHARDGAFYGSPWQTFDVATLPRDPQALYDWFDAYNNGGGASRDEENWENLVELVRGGGVPADLRAAAYKAIAMIPGVTVGDRAATLDGRTGIALGRTELLRGGMREEIIVDPDTGLLIGERQLMTLPLFGFKAGEVTGSTSVTTTVVDSAP